MAFNPGTTPDVLNRLAKNTMVEHLGIEFTEVGDAHISARMPVDRRTHQPFGLLHGGASVVLAETLGSVAANYSIDQERQYAVGLEINANHLKGVKSGWVYGTTTAIHAGRTTQVWDIRITNEEGAMVCISRITIAILEKR